MSFSRLNKSIQSVTSDTIKGQYGVL